MKVKEAQIDRFIERHVSDDASNVDNIRVILGRYSIDVIYATDSGLNRVCHNPEIGEVTQFIQWIEQKYTEVDAVDLFGYLLEQYGMPLGPTPPAPELSKFGKYLGRFIGTIIAARGIYIIAPRLARKLAAERGWKLGGAEQDRYRYITDSEPYIDALAISYVSSVIDGDDEAAQKIIGNRMRAVSIVGRIAQLLEQDELGRWTQTRSE